MNPLGLNAARFIVAEGGGNDLIGFGQLAPLGGGDASGPQRLELKSLIIEPEYR